MADLVSGQGVGDPDPTRRFWQDYLIRLPADHPHRLAQAPAFAFGDSVALADELADLVVAGRKRATTSLAVEFTADGCDLPQQGDLSIVLRGDGRPVALIELTSVRPMAFGQVGQAYAAREGEGDAMLETWRQDHLRYFSRVVARHGGHFDEQTVVLCQEFRVLWPPQAADPDDRSPLSAPPVAALRIGASGSELRLSGDAGAQHAWSLPIGAERLGGWRFRHHPPDAFDLETGIALIEDAVMPLAKHVPQGLMLRVAGEGIGSLFGALSGWSGAERGGTCAGVFGLSSIEALYQQLAAVAQGRPVASSGLPDDRAFAAALLIVRECLHHLAFTGLETLPDDIPAQPSPDRDTPV